MSSLLVFGDKSRKSWVSSHGELGSMLFSWTQPHPSGGRLFANSRRGWLLGVLWPSVSAGGGKWKFRCSPRVTKCFRQFPIALIPSPICLKLKISDIRSRARWRKKWHHSNETESLFNQCASNSAFCDCYRLSRENLISCEFMFSWKRQGRRVFGESSPRWTYHRSSRINHQILTLGRSKYVQSCFDVLTKMRKAENANTKQTQLKCPASVD